MISGLANLTALEESVGWLNLENVSSGELSIGNYSAPDVLVTPNN